MPFRPLEHLQRRKVQDAAREAAQEGYAEHHWGAHLSYPVGRREGKPLVFELRLPDGMELVDVVKLAQAARGAPAFVGQGLTALQSAERLPGVVVVGALRPDDTPQDQRPVLATVTVVFTELQGPFNVDDFMPKDGPNTTHSKQDVTQISDRLTGIHRISTESQGEGQEPLPMLLLEYLWQSPFGLVAIAFCTTRLDMMSDVARKLYDEIRQSMYLGEEPSVVA
jgi:hypothetical protein